MKKEGAGLSDSLESRLTPVRICCAQYDTWFRPVLKSALIPTALPSRIALVTYYGLEGLGTLQIDSEDDFEEVSTHSIDQTGLKSSADMDDIY